jgi:glycosyltransferase involved in cell wall biosynthesis
MTKAAYITFDQLDPNNGAGLVCLHEINALGKVADDLKIISRKDVAGMSKYDFNPFLADYFSAATYNGPEGIDLLHLSCSPGLALLNRIRPKAYVVNCPAHDLKTSIEEHERYYGKGSYKLVHNTDDYLHELLLRHAKHADAMITPSSSSARWIASNIRPKRVEVISHGCDIPGVYWAPPAEFRVGYLGAFGPDKSLHLLLLAWKDFIGNGKMVFGGNCKNSIEQLARVMNIPLTPDRWELTGWLDTVSVFYDNISVYCQVSASEGFGIETLEAMAHGRPVIVSSGAGSADAVTDGVDGFIVPPLDSQAILDKINYFAANPHKIIEMGAAARLKATNYSWHKIEEKYVEFYKGILGGIK